MGDLGEGGSLFVQPDCSKMMSAASLEHPSLHVHALASWSTSALVHRALCGLVTPVLGGSQVPSWEELTLRIEDKDFTLALSSDRLLSLRKSVVSPRVFVTSPVAGWELGLKDVMILGCCK